MLRDLLYAARSLRSSPAFALAAILTLALGIGASTAIFSVANAVILRPLPYKDPGRLVYICSDMLKRNVYDHFWSDPDFLDLRNHASSVLEDAAAVLSRRGGLPRDDGTLDEVGFATVTPNLFRVLGVHVALGRDFIESDGLPQAPTVNGAPPPPDQRLPTMAIVSYGFFQRRFGGNPAALGQPIVKNGPILVGVVAQGTELLFRPDKNMERSPDLFLAARLNPGSPRISIAWRVIARLRPGVSLQRAQAQVDAVAEQCRDADTVNRTAGLSFRVEPMHQYLVAQVRPAILALMGAAVFLLLIACSNVANLFLVRSSLRSRDLAVRTAMGASWWRLARQMLAEALLVAALGSAAGFALAWAGIRELLAIAPGNLPRLDAVAIDPAVLLFTIGAGAVAAVLFGLMPALRSARPDVAQVLRASGRTAGLTGGALLRNGVVVAEVALCFVMLVGSGLMFRSFIALQHIDPGFDPRGVLTFRGLGGKPTTTAESRDAVVRQMHDALAAIPGAESVTAANELPLNGEFFAYRWGKEDALADPTKFLAADAQIVLPGYFEAMHIPLIAGRTFNESDNTADARHIVVDQFLAAKAFPGRNAVGQRILMRFRTPQPEWFEIVGVAEHQRLTSLADPGREQAWITDGYFGHRAVPEWAVRVRGDAAAYADRVRSAMQSFDPAMRVTKMQSMDAIVERAQEGTRFSLLLITVFAAIAALLAGVGLYGVLSSVVRQRTAEIGVRMALGAAPNGIFGLVIGHGLRLSAAGVGTGLLAALLLTRVMTSMLVGIRATDPATYAGMAVLFFAIATVSTWLPARRAAALDPATALREE